MKNQHSERRTWRLADAFFTPSASAFRIAVLSGMMLCFTTAITVAKDDLLHQQEMLIWTTDYEGLIDGKAGPETIKAIQKFQTRLGNSPTGKLTAAEELALDQMGNAKK